MSIPEGGEHEYQEEFDRPHNYHFGAYQRCLYQFHSWLVIESQYRRDLGSDSITWVFGSDGEFNVTVNGSEVARGQYEVDYSMEPYQLDLVYENGFLVYTIFELTDSDTMRMESALPDPDGSRPTSFTDYAVFQRADQ